MTCEGRDIGVMTRKPVRRCLASGAMMLRVEDRSLLPERPVDAQSHDVALPIGHRGGKGVKKPRRDGMTPDRLLVRQGAELELHGTSQVVEARRLVRRVVEKQIRRTAGRVSCVLKPGSALGFAKNGFRLGLESWLELLLNRLCTGCLGKRHPFVGLVAARAWFGEPEQCRGDRQIDVLGKTLDDLEHLRQRRASLEDQALAELRAEEHTQQPADPEIFF